LIHQIDQAMRGEESVLEFESDAKAVLVTGARLISFDISGVLQEKDAYTTYPYLITFEVLAKSLRFHSMVVMARIGFILLNIF
jgi:hypothetical protein